MPATPQVQVMAFHDLTTDKVMEQNPSKQSRPSMQLYIATAIII